MRRESAERAVRFCVMARSERSAANATYRETPNFGRGLFMVDQCPIQA
ncbi:hypothetical protein A7982_13209 [Minicystis rosea]|nr:hypothetical protein A7982_13209 [Minicystis rosea]